MQLVITEKPSVAQDVAKVLGAHQRQRGFFLGNGYYITWLHGHLLEIVPKDDPGWDLQKMPFIPERFHLEPASEYQKDENGKTIKTTIFNEQKLELIKDLVGKSDGVVIATDAGREGEIIAREVLKYIHCEIPKDKWKRLWISSLTEEAIAEGFKNLYPASDFDNLAKAAMERTIADWLVGINGTRILSLSCRQNGQEGHRKMLSLGRVQTAVLKMICLRHLERVNFRSQTYWVLAGTSVIDGIQMKWRGVETYTDRMKADKARAAVINKRYLQVASVETKRVNEASPLLHNIDSVQKMANQRYGYTLEDTLAAVQSLYEKKYCSYPRTDSRYISEDVFKTVPGLLKVLTRSKAYGDIAQLLWENTDKLSKRSVNDTKLTDHHALIVTKNLLPEENDLSEIENRVYELILMRFLEAFAPDCVADITTVKLIGGDNVEFRVRGRKEIRTGWKMINRDMDSEELDFQDADKQELDMGELPPLTQGMNIPIAALDLDEDKTKPLPYYTDATILTAMENAGRQTDDKQMAQTLNKVGLGTAATRSAILEKLVKVEFVKRKNKSLVPDELGLKVFNVVKDMMISNVELTANWEMQLNDIAEGKLEPKIFRENVEIFTKKMAKELFDSQDGFNELTNYVESIQVKCPLCGSEVIIYDKNAKCTNKECNFNIYRQKFGKMLGKSTIVTLIKEGQTRVIKGFVNKNGVAFDAVLKLNEKGDIEPIFDKKKRW